MKLTKTAAHYTSHADYDHCEDCTMFRAAGGKYENNSCTLVAGVIDRKGHCKYFEKKTTKMKVGK